MTLPRPSLTLSLLQAREAVMAFFRPVLNAHSLTEQQWRVIRILHQHGVLECHRLAELACILAPSMSGVLKRLERDGMVTRRKSFADRRKVFFELTEQGGQTFTELNGEMDVYYDRVLSRFGSEKTSLLISLLEQMRDIKP